MSTYTIDGKAEANKLLQKITAEVAEIRAENGEVPGLAVVLVGDDPASQVYVASKRKQTLEVGMTSFEHRLPVETAQEEILALIDALNEDPKVHGILVQLPLPKHIDQSVVLARIHPGKDVDGFHVENAGRLATGQPGIVPCTPLGAMILLKSVIKDLAGLNAVMVGCSNIVGKPMAQLLLSERCTVTLAHSRTRNLPALLGAADIVIVAIGKPEFVQGEWLKPGATVIDVGINRIPAPEKGEGKSRLVGDIEYFSAARVAGAITPVPGGVGPMTIACLLLNTLTAYTSGRP